MMVLINFAVSTAVLHGIATAAAAVLEQRATCPLTETNSYAYSCAQAGWVQAPSYLKVLKNVPELQNCAHSCNANAACKSFRYVDGTKKCYLYKKYLAAMAFTTDNFQSGVLYERECFTTDCNVIDACNAFTGCPSPTAYRYLYYDYQEFGCGYGVTAKLKKFLAAEKVLAGNLTTCQAITNCASKAPSGSFVVSYYLPSKKWLCDLYDNAPKYDYYPTLHQQHITDMTLTFKNASIGASYGYWLYAEYNPDD